MSMMIFSGRMPLPPGINQSYKIVCIPTRRGTVRTLGPTVALEAFKRDASLMLRSAQKNSEAIQLLQAQKHKTPLSVTLKFFFPTLWLRDVDGGIKAAMDATFEHIGLNDNTVTRVAAEKYVDRKDPRCEIEVHALQMEVA